MLFRSALEGERPKGRKNGSIVTPQPELAAALEEERRLAYVAVTRAREELFISSPAQHRGKKAEVSRFLLSAFPMAAAATSTASRPVTGRTLPSMHSIAGRTHAIPVWTCTGTAGKDSKKCPGWTRRKTGGDEDHLSSKPCPLCKIGRAHV